MGHCVAYNRGKMELSLDKRQLCDIQGRLFELAVKKGYDCPRFIHQFMNSRTAAALDDVYDRLQWAGEEYILEELNDEVSGLLVSSHSYDREIMYWIGYTYRYWHYYTGAMSRDIYQIADAEEMASSWLGFHTLDVEMAIDNLIEIHKQRQQQNNA